MDANNILFIAIIIGLSTGGWLINNWIRAKHGYPLEDEWGGKTKRADSREAEQLRAENSALKGQIDAMQDRLVVLEKIVTDRGYSLAQEIDALRDTRRVDEQGSGVPLGLERNRQTGERV